VNDRHPAEAKREDRLQAGMAIDRIETDVIDAQPTASDRDEPLQESDGDIPRV
jgi:hypothetical protein